MPAAIGWASAVAGVAAGIPVPLPQTGQEAIWNHIGRYRGSSLERTIGQVTPLANGAYTMVMFKDQLAVRNGNAARQLGLNVGDRLVVRRGH